MTRCDCSCFHCERDDHYYCPREYGCVLRRPPDPEFDDEEQLHLDRCPEVDALDLVDQGSIVGFDLDDDGEEQRRREDEQVLRPRCYECGADCDDCRCPR